MTFVWDWLVWIVCVIVVDNMKNAFKISFGGIVSAISLMLMLLTGLIPVGTYAFPCFSGMLLVALVIEFGEKWSYLAYIAVSLLSFFIAGDKEAVLYFVMFFGFYPILKSSLEKINSKLIQYILKYCVFNICIIIAFFIGKFVFMIPDEEFTLFGVYMPLLFLIIANIFFVFYDRCVSIAVYYYINKIRNKVFKK